MWQNVRDADCKSFLRRYNRSANYTKVELTSESMPLKMHRKNTGDALNRYNVKGMSIKRNIHWLVYNSTPQSFVMITTHHECMLTYTSTVCWYMTNLLAIYVLPVSRANTAILTNLDSCSRIEQKLCLNKPWFMTPFSMTTDPRLFLNLNHSQCITVNHPIIPYLNI